MLDQSGVDAIWQAEWMQIDVVVAYPFDKALAHIGPYIGGYVKSLIEREKKKKKTVSDFCSMAFVRANDIVNCAKLSVH